MKIRRMKEGDIPYAAQIIGENYSSNFRRSSIKEMRAMFRPGAVKPYYLVAEDKKKVVGFGGYTQSWMDYSVYELFWINVQKNSQGRGIGTKVVKRLIRIIKRQKPVFILLTTDKPHFYSRLGFKKMQHFKKNGYTVMGLTV